MKDDDELAGGNKPDSRRTGRGYEILERFYNQNIMEAAFHTWERLNTNQIELGWRVALCLKREKTKIVTLSVSR